MKWIKASEKLPPVKKLVIIRDNNGTVYEDSAKEWDKSVTDYKWLDETESPSDSEAVELLKEYDQWEADLINDNAMWWPHAPKDRISGQTYDKMMELQGKRNRILHPDKYQ